MQATSANSHRIARCKHAPNRARLLIKQNFPQPLHQSSPNVYTINPQDCISSRLVVHIIKSKTCISSIRRIAYSPQCAKGTHHLQSKHHIEDTSFAVRQTSHKNKQLLFVFVLPVSRFFAFFLFLFALFGSYLLFRDEFALVNVA